MSSTETSRCSRTLAAFGSGTCWKVIRGSASCREPTVAQPSPSISSLSPRPSSALQNDASRSGSAQSIVTPYHWFPTTSACHRAHETARRLRTGKRLAQHARRQLGGVALVPAAVTVELGSGVARPSPRAGRARAGAPGPPQRRPSGARPRRAARRAARPSARPTGLGRRSCRRAARPRRRGRRRAADVGSPSRATSRVTAAITSPSRPMATSVRGSVSRPAVRAADWIHGPGVPTDAGGAPPQHADLGDELWLIREQPEKQRGALPHGGEL